MNGVICITDFEFEYLTNYDRFLLQFNLLIYVYMKFNIHTYFHFQKVFFYNIF